MEKRKNKKCLWFNNIFLGTLKQKYCTVKCGCGATALQRGEKTRKKQYPIILGKCKKCNNDIVIKNSSFDKPTRQFCSKSCKISVNNSNRVWKEESKQKIGKANRGKKRSLEVRMKQSKESKGSRAPNWQGGITPENRRIRNSIEYKLWREAVFKRDNYLCVWGGKEHGNKLHADHIKTFALYPELRFAIDNGRTLCVECHKKTDSYGGKFRIYYKKHLDGESINGVPY
jgi:5-methylcytosine-specific restriction endonuclease McrA